MAVLNYEDGVVVLHGPYSLRNVVRELGGVWDVHKGCWVFAEDANLTALCALDFIDMTPQAKTHLCSDSTPTAIRNMDDAPIMYGDDLFAYQRVGVRFLSTARRAILNDDVGLGKSVQAIRACHEVGAHKVLVVTKKSIIYNWQKQIEMWNKIPHSTWEVMNYERVVRDKDILLHNKYTALIVDEAQYIKNLRLQKSKSPQRAVAIAALAKKIPYVFLLTANVLQNNPTELWGLLRTLYPKKYTSYWRFVETYCDIGTNSFTGYRNVLGLKESSKPALTAEMSTVMLGRNKVGLPPLTQEVMYAQLGNKQREAYDQMLKQFFILIDEDESILHAGGALAQLTRLRQLSLCPALIGGTTESAKLDMLCDLVESYAPDHKILVFSMFRGFVDIITKTLNKYNAVSITGANTELQRRQAEDTFLNDNTCRVLVGSKAMVEGMNLQSATIVIFTDIDWVPTTMDQATGRAHRTGQTKPVHVITIIADDTVDQHMYDVATGKETVINEFDAMTRVIQKLKGE